LVLTLIIAGDVLYAQKPRLSGQAKIDSLLKELPEQKEDTNKCNILYRISSLYNSINPDEGIVFGRQDSALATKLMWKKGIAAANDVLGDHYGSKADYTKALQYYLIALNIKEEIGDKQGGGTA